MTLENPTRCGPLTNGLAYSFQMVSLLKLAKVTEEGVRFLSPHDGSQMYVVWVDLDRAEHCWSKPGLT